MADLHLNQPVPTAGANAVASTLTSGIIFPSASRAQGTYTSDEIFNPWCRGVRLYIANDAAGGSTVVAKIQVRAPNSDVWIDLTNATSGTVNSSTGTIVTIYPGLTGIADAAGSMINQHLGPCWRVHMTIGTATGTSSVGADYLL